MQHAKTTALDLRHRDAVARRALRGKSMRVLVTGSHTFFGGRLIQGLGTSGCTVTAADAARFSCGRSSKHARVGLRTPSLRENPAGLFEALVAELRSGSYDLLVPTFEEAILLSDHRDVLDPLVRTFLPPPGVAWNLHHKGRLHRFCREAGIPSPPTLLADDPDQWGELAGQLGYPAFVKPAVGLGSIARSRCANEQDVLAGFAGVAATGLGVDPLLQRAIDGEVVSVLMFCHEGRVLGDVLYRSLRTFPDDCGTSAHRESIEHPAVSRVSRQLVEASGWSGFLGLDVVVEKGTGRTYVIDANPRCTPAVQLGYVAGVDWSALLMDLVRGRDPEPMTARPGVRARSLIFDTGWMLEGFARRRGWLRRGCDRLRGFLFPEWSLDSKLDLLHGDLRATLAMVGYTFSCLARGYLEGRSLGDLLFRESTYDRRTAESVIGPRQRDAMPTDVPPPVAVPIQSTVPAKRPVLRHG